EFLLDGGRADAVKSEVHLVQQRRTEAIRVAGGHVPEPRIGQQGKPGGRGSDLRGRQGLVLIAVRTEKAPRQLTSRGWQKMQVCEEVILAEPGGYAEGGESTEREGLRRVDRLRCRDRILSVGEPEIEQCQSRRADVRAVGRHCYGTEGGGLSGEESA